MHSSDSTSLPVHLIERQINGLQQSIWVCDLFSMHYYAASPAHSTVYIQGGPNNRRIRPMFELLTSSIISSKRLDRFKCFFGTIQQGIVLNTAVKSTLNKV